MARVRELPPPPENPSLSPPASVAGEELVTLPGLDGEPSLEARVRAPSGARRAVVLCHPHPLYGGTMHSAVVLAIAKVLAEKGREGGEGGEENHAVAHLRFNYRGVGASGGRYGEGLGEIEDTRAAIRALRARAPGAKMSVCGYSFGTFVGLRAAVIEGGVERVTLVAPAVRVFHFVKEDGAAFQGRLAIFVGDADEFCDVSEAEELARDLGARLTVVPGADHYFLKSRRKLAEAVVPVVAPEVIPPQV
jgi:alpha/beta superfamily hydrolase